MADEKHRMSPKEYSEYLQKVDLTSIIDTASEGDAKYSIQVGLYGIKINAERKVGKLKGLKLSGHLTNFINDKGDTLYNVRFGYFLNKASVIAALETTVLPSLATKL